MPSQLSLKDSDLRPQRRRICPVELCFICLLTAATTIGCLGQTQNLVDVEQVTNGESPQGESTQLDSLIAANDLHAVLSDGICVLEVGRDKSEYERGHIKGARFVDWIKDITDPAKPNRYNVADKDAMQTLFRSLGINKDSPVIIYDNLCSRIAARMYWSMKYYGHDNVRVLDGGRSAWLASGFPLIKETTKVVETNYTIDHVNEEYRVEMNYLARQLNQPNVQLVDGRPEKQFTGEEPGKVFHTGTPHKNRGHIPSAMNVCWKQNFKDDGTFKSMEDLRKLYADKGIRQDSTVIAYCNEGLHAALPWFVLKEILGYDDVRIYDDSMSEWANSDQPTSTSE